jgi:hypothetical protein
MKALKSLYDKLQANKWVYWFVSVSIILIISQHIHGKFINEILFAQYAPVASKIEAWIFIIVMGYIVLRWIQSFKNKKSKE